MADANQARNCELVGRVGISPIFMVFDAKSPSSSNAMFIIYERTLLSTNFVARKRTRVCDCPRAHLKPWDLNGLGMKTNLACAGRTVGSQAGGANERVWPAGRLVL